ncbi:hypothetical protein GCM10028801_46450 [Nocardioides maradonensis]
MFLSKIRLRALAAVYAHYLSGMSVTSDVEPTESGSSVPRRMGEIFTDWVRERIFEIATDGTPRQVVMLLDMLGRSTVRDDKLLGYCVAVVGWEAAHREDWPEILTVLREYTDRPSIRRVLAYMTRQPWFTDGGPK